MFEVEMEQFKSNIYRIELTFNYVIFLVGSGTGQVQRAANMSWLILFAVYMF